MAEGVVAIEDIDEFLEPYTEGTKGRTIEFVHSIGEDDLARPTLSLQAKIVGKDFIVIKTMLLPTGGLLEESLGYLAIGLRSMLETADDQAQIGGLSPLLPDDVVEEEE